RYVAHLPSRGELVMFDRSWYNRAGVERVMGFCTDSQYETFMEQAPMFEKMLVDSGIGLTKFWFSGAGEGRKRRAAIRRLDAGGRGRRTAVGRGAVGEGHKRNR